MNKTIKNEFELMVPIKKYLERFVPTIIRTGKGFTCFCPFRKEATPNFNISPLEELAWCDECDRGGNIIEVAEELVKSGHKDAKKILSEMAMEEKECVKKEIKLEIKKFQLQIKTLKLQLKELK